MWPFSLSNSKDGFWDAKIRKPFLKKQPESLKLLRLLLANTMMRHSKSQLQIKQVATSSSSSSSIVTYEPILEMPPRRIEWRGFPILDESEMFLAMYFENFAASALASFARNFGEVDAASMHRYSQIRSIYALISRCLTHPQNLTLQTIDHLRRLLIPAYLGFFDGYMRGLGDLRVGPADRNVVRVCTPESALRILQGAGQVRYSLALS